MNALRNMLLILVVSASYSTLSAVNLIQDHSFENGIDPLPGLGAVVGPPFAPGFWGAERGGEVQAERGVWPADLVHMLYMEDEGLTVTQAFQAVNVSAFATLIDSGNAAADFRAVANTYLQGQVFVPALLFFSNANGWGSPIGQMGWNQALDSDANTWENFVALHPIPVGTRWIVAQVGFDDRPLPNGERAYVDSVYLNVVPEPGTAVALLAGVAGIAARRVRRRR